MDTPGETQEKRAARSTRQRHCSTVCTMRSKRFRQATEKEKKLCQGRPLANMPGYLVQGYSGRPLRWSNIGLGCNDIPTAANRKRKGQRYNKVIISIRVPRCSYWRRRCRFRGGPIRAALKRLNCSIVTPGKTTALSASSTSLFLRRISAALSSSFLHAAMNLRPPSITVSHHVPGSRAATVQSPSIPNTRM